MLPLFKPTKSGTGILVSFSLQASRKEKNKSGLYFQLTKQSGPLSKPFANSKEKAIIKFNELELSAMLNAIERRTKFSTVHKQGDAPGRSIVFDTLYRKDEAGNFTKEVYGFSFNTSLNSAKFGFTLSLAESVLIREFFKFCLQHLFSGRYSEEKLRIKAAKVESESAEEPANEVELD